MNRLRHRLFLRYAVAVALIVVMTALALALALHASMRDALAVSICLAVLLVTLGIITIWTQRTLSSDLRELGRVLQKIVVGGDIESIPRPRFFELSDLAGDMDEVAEQVRSNYRDLAGQRDWLEAVLDNINAGVIVVNRRLKIDMINPVAEKILGTTRGYALGRTFTEIHHTSAIDRAIEKSHRGASVSREVRISFPRSRALSVFSNPIRDKRGRTTGVICVIEDITERRKLERVRRDFVANVSHELRTPVANLRAVVEALIAGASEEPEARERFMADLDSESRRLACTIEDLLMLSRLEIEEAGVAAERFEVEEMLREVLSEKRPLAGRHEVSLAYEGDRPGAAVTGDRNLIKAAMGNLLDNAIKYNRPGGRVEVSLDHGEGRLTISVADTGMGIPPGDLDKIFERFYRVDKARSRETGGTGLGLSIVKHAVEFHGGRVAVTSTEGRGSTFSLTLPESPDLL